MDYKLRCSVTKQIKYADELYKRKSFQLGYGCMMVAVKCVSGVTFPLQNGLKKRMLFSITTVGSSKTLNAVFLKTFGTLRCT